ncbi:MAG: transposase [Solirubrobacterales bacterium]|nr:transposase [Solirubrobacterales bacterium]
MSRPQKYPDELIQRGVRLVFESGRPIAQIARDLGVARRRCGGGCARPRSTKAGARG